ncbi:hypothetical protein CTAYLR_004063 [Chrysophaeum taylorii]|uniref:Uncharacterized protein n=1 Tax=Chrysophaeum taylorii TaxID=2483200 RepID=A0AAD7UMR5_9STRA|nr:hypothetical protein CTAYLR_004063 [Chrysophaeum taylorii]
MVVRATLLLRRRLATASHEAVVEAMRSLSLVEDVAPLASIVWSPTPQELRHELSLRPRHASAKEMVAATPEIDPFSVVRPELRGMASRMSELVKIDHPLLASAACHLFEGDAGKKFRAAMVLLVSKACNGAPTPRQTRLAEIVEMIHTASLFHDDVIDGAPTRRGVASVNNKFGDKVAILAGDFLLARACVALSRLRDCDVVEVLAAVIEHLVRGEIVQMRPRLCDNDSLLEAYLAKNFYKTGSLMANGCRAAAMLEDSPLCDAAFRYGRHLGLAFQLVDDVLDYCGSEADLGKPKLADLRQGLATAPVLFALNDHPDLLPLVTRKFALPGDVDAALALVYETNAIDRARDLAYVQADLAKDALDPFPPSDAKDALLSLATKVVTRNH